MRALDEVAAVVSFGEGHTMLAVAQGRRLGWSQVVVKPKICIREKIMI